MNLNPTELERLTIFTAAEMARRHRAQGTRLSHPEAVALIADEVLAAARKGAPHADLVEYGRTLLTADDVEPGVEHLIPFVRVEADIAEGTRLVTVSDPIRPGRGSKSIEPVPDGDVKTAVVRKHVALDVLNTGHHAIQVRNHSHFFEVHRALKFDRAAAFGMRLDRSSGTAMRFEPGEITHVELVAIGTSGQAHGFDRLAENPIHAGEVRRRALRLARERNFNGT